MAILIQRTAWLVLTVLLCALPGCLEKQKPEPAERSVPVKSLLAELPDRHDAQTGAAAYIRTPFKKGLGVLKRATGEVVTARHNVLTPSGAIAGDIVVGVSQAASPTLLETSSTVIAQDPESDLVLLRLDRPAAGTATSPAGAAQPPTHVAAGAERTASAEGLAAMPAVPAADPQELDLQGAPQHGRERHRRGRRRHSGPSQVPAFSPSPTLHVVYDGPLSRRRG